MHGKISCFTVLGNLYIISITIQYHIAFPSACRRPLTSNFSSIKLGAMAIFEPVIIPTFVLNFSKDKIAEQC